MQPLPFTLINPDATSNWLLVCEHASNTVPASLQQLGLGDDMFDTHIAYDIGAEEMTRYLAKKLNASAILCNYSRLVIDCNRSLVSPTCIPPTSDGVAILANQQLSQSERQWRIQQIYYPFHTAVFQVLTEKLTRHPQLRFANIHSFTPALTETGVSRPWHIGFIHRNHALALAIMKDFCDNTHYCIGDNEPYNGFIHKGYTVPAHADAQEIPSLLVEFRQDLINTPTGVTQWGDLLLSAIQRHDDTL